MKLQSGDETKYLWIKGPAKIRVEEGSIEINGASFFRGESVLMHLSRSYTMKVLPRTSLDITLSTTSSLDSAEEQDIASYEEWKRKAEEIAEKCISKAKCKIVIVGETDSGKTTFATMLGNSLLKRGSVPVILDADPGQNTIGFPGFIAAGKYSIKSIWPSDIGWEKLYFVGKLSPAGIESEMIIGAMKLSQHYRDGILIVDTDGWFADLRSYSYKYRLINSLMPDFSVVICQNECGVLKRIIEGETEAVFLKSPPRRAVRSREERILIKSDKVLNLIASERTREISLSSVILMDRGRIIDVREASIEDFSRRLENMLCALISPDGWASGAGIIAAVRDGERLLIKTDYMGEVKIIQFGYIKLADNRLIEIVSGGAGSGRSSELRRSFQKGGEQVRRQGKGVQRGA